MTGEATAMGSLQTAGRDEGRAAEAATQIVAFHVGGQDYCVDAVLDILAVGEGERAPIPDTGGEEQIPYLAGLVTQNECMVAMIALDHLITEAIVQ